MPHQVVVHLHAVEILAWLVRNNSERDIGAVLGSRYEWTSTGYHKPGAALAQAVNIALDNVPGASTVLYRITVWLSEGRTLTRSTINFGRLPIY